jgi:hypothetical protein
MKPGKVILRQQRIPYYQSYAFWAVRSRELYSRIPRFVEYGGWCSG